MSIMISWDNKFEVGHERIDAEHRIFLNLIRELSQEAEAKENRERIGRTLRELFKYADFHFTSEENIMADINYPSLDEHRRIHQMLIAQLERAIHDFHTGEETPEQIVDFLFQWFALHTTREDKWITQFLAQ